MPRFDHTCFRLVPLGHQEELLHLHDTPLAPGDGRTQPRCSRVKPLGHGLSLLAELKLESMEQSILQVLAGYSADTEQEASEFRAEPLAGCSCFPPCGTLPPELLWEDWVILEIGAFQVVLDEDVLFMLAEIVAINNT